MENSVMQYETCVVMFANVTLVVSLLLAWLNIFVDKTVVLRVWILVIILYFIVMYILRLNVGPVYPRIIYVVK